MATGPRKMGMRKMIGMKRAGAKMPKAMKAPKAMGPALLEGQVPPMAGPMPQGMPGMKKGGAVKKDASKIVGKGPSPAAAKADYKKKMAAAGFPTKGGRGGVAERGLGKAAKGFAKGGMAKAPKAGLGIMIILGKKKGK
jgi:hypothetical protein